MERNYHVDFKMYSDIINAYIEFEESVTGNKVSAVCYPNLIKVQTIEIDGVEYDVQGYVGEVKLYTINDGKYVRSKKLTNECIEIANSIIKKGNQYLRNTFGNIDKEVIEIN